MIHVMYWSDSEICFLFWRPLSGICSHFAFISPNLFHRNAGLELLTGMASMEISQRRVSHSAGWVLLAMMQQGLKYL